MKHPKPQHRQLRHGFTLVEMLLVLVILSTLAALVYPKISGTTARAQITAARTQIDNIKAAVDHYEIDAGYYPKDLDALFNAPGDNNNWHGPYLEKAIPPDPWGNAYLYEYPGKHNPSGPDISSAGPDGRPGTDDDINNWDANKK